MRGRIPAAVLAWILLVGSAAVAAMDQARNGKAVIALAPIGAVAADVLDALAPAVGDAFDAQVVVAPELSLHKAAYDRHRRQYLSRTLLDELARARRPEWVRLLGVVDVDLYVPELNFVFGEGDFHRGVAVFSLARLHSPDQALYRRRVVTEAIHELGHAYGLTHCDDLHCVMWFSNTLAESDRKGTGFCRAHAGQLAAARKQDPGL